jgi:hypothetical protein
VFDISPRLLSPRTPINVAHRYAQVRVLDPSLLAVWRDNSSFVPSCFVGSSFQLRPANSGGLSSSVTYSGTLGRDGAVTIASDAAIPVDGGLVSCTGTVSNPTPYERFGSTVAPGSVCYCYVAMPASTERLQLLLPAASNAECIFKLRFVSSASKACNAQFGASISSWYMTGNVRAGGIVFLSTDPTRGLAAQNCSGVLQIRAQPQGSALQLSCTYSSDPTPCDYSLRLSITTPPDNALIPAPPYTTRPPPGPSISLAPTSWVGRLLLRRHPHITVAPFGSPSCSVLPWCTSS